ncbi:MAG: thioredoxin family protein [Candidatus Micrarchaeota archaeon]|nr:thioredoxin family protein [Candidatus Micrarchaeota archaeon]
MLDNETKQEIHKRLSGMQNEVEILFFPGPDENSAHIREMLKGLGSITPKLKVVLYDEAAPEAASFSIQNVPVMIFRGPGIKGDARFYGFPGGLEFPVFIEFIALAGSTERTGPFTGIIPLVKETLLVESLVSPACHFCPTAAYLTLKLALMSEHIKGYVYEIQEFPYLAQKYQVQAVPRTIVNDGKLDIRGAQPEDVFAMLLKRLLTGQPAN